MRIILAVIASACAIAVLIDTSRRQLAAQLESDWRQYQEHVGIPAFSATFENLQNSLKSRLDTER